VEIVFVVFSARALSDLTVDRLHQRGPKAEHPPRRACRKQ
jgi:hypothetical protein